VDPSPASLRSNERSMITKRNPEQERGNYLIKGSLTVARIRLGLLSYHRDENAGLTPSLIGGGGTYHP